MEKKSSRGPRKPAKKRTPKVPPLPRVFAEVPKELFTDIPAEPVVVVALPKSVWQKIEEAWDKFWE